MKLRLLNFYDLITESFWFLPSLMAICALGAALGTVALDERIGSAWVQDITWIWSGGADGARSVLSVIAGSVMTVVSIVFSITVTALAQTSSQFGPRVLRNFTSDRGNQFVLGTFISAFVYCLIVLRTVRSVEEAAFVPYISVNIGIASALAALAVLIYFIHHITQSIQAENLIAEVGHDFQRVLPVLFPERLKGSESDLLLEEQKQDKKSQPDWKQGVPVHSDGNGYVQRIDEKEIMNTACRLDVVIRINKRPGDFVTDDSTLITVFPAERMQRHTEAHLRNCFALGSYRTPHQDADYPLQQLAEIGAHALSPGINEPFTALTVIDWLGACLTSVAERALPFAFRRDHKGVLRIVAKSVTFEEMTNTAFDQIRIYGCGNPAVVQRLLETITDLAPHLHREADRQALIHHANLIHEEAQRITNPHDRELLALKHSEALGALAKGL
jgi:uncharacterized membrane protein